eukprot:8649568-Pyramimonas_sp.AAC.1
MNWCLTLKRMVAPAHPSLAPAPYTSTVHTECTLQANGRRARSGRSVRLKWTVDTLVNVTPPVSSKRNTHHESEVCLRYELHPAGSRVPRAHRQPIPPKPPQSPGLRRGEGPFPQPGARLPSEHHRRRINRSANRAKARVLGKEHLHAPRPSTSAMYPLASTLWPLPSTLWPLASTLYSFRTSSLAAPAYVCGLLKRSCGRIVTKTVCWLWKSLKTAVALLGAVLSVNPVLPSAVAAGSTVRFRDGSLASVGPETAISRR